MAQDKALTAVPPERIAGMATAAFIEHFAEMIRGAIPLLETHRDDTGRVVLAHHREMLVHLRCIQDLHRDSVACVEARARIEAEPAVAL